MEVHNSEMGSLGASFALVVSRKAASGALTPAASSDI
jgi:hypothetical protein